MNWLAHYPLKKHETWIVVCSRAVIGDDVWYADVGGVCTTGSAIYNQDGVGSLPFDIIAMKINDLTFSNWCANDILPQFCNRWNALSLLFLLFFTKCPRFQLESQNQEVAKKHPPLPWFFISIFSTLFHEFVVHHKKEENYITFYFTKSTILLF